MAKIPQTQITQEQLQSQQTPKEFANYFEQLFDIAPEIFFDAAYRNDKKLITDIASGVEFKISDNGIATSSIEMLNDDDTNFVRLSKIAYKMIEALCKDYNDELIGLSEIEQDYHMLLKREAVVVHYAKEQIFKIVQIIADASKNRA